MASAVTPIEDHGTSTGSFADVGGFGDSTTVAVYLVGDLLLLNLSTTTSDKLAFKFSDWADADAIVLPANATGTGQFIYPIPDRFKLALLTATGNRRLQVKGASGTPNFQVFGFDAGQ